MKLLPSLVLIAGCATSDVGDQPREIATEASASPAVLRDCATTAGNICPWAGAGLLGFDGDDAHRLDAMLAFPLGIAVPVEGGDPVVVDAINHRLRRVEPDPASGLDTVLGGEATPLSAPVAATFLPDGTLVYTSKDGVGTWDPVTGATGALGELDVIAPTDLVADASGEHLYVVDAGNGRVQHLDLVTGAVDTVIDGLSVDERSDPEPGGALAITPDGQTLYVADTFAHVILEVELATGASAVLTGVEGEAGAIDGALADARWRRPSGLALDVDTGELFVADTDNHRVRVVDLDAGTVAAAVGTGQPTCASEDLAVPVVCEAMHDAGDGGPALEATLYRPWGVSLDGDGNLLVADTYDQRLRIVYR